MKFQVKISGKALTFDSNINGLKINSKEYLAGKDGQLIYYKTKDLKAEEVTLQMSTNTSTLVPALKVLSLKYSSYFDRKEIIESQNDITFYWNKSKLAAYYNKFSTDELDYKKRRSVIKKAVDFIVKNHKSLPLKEEFLKQLLEPCIVLGFYNGFPIFDSATGFAKLRSRLGIHIDPENIMISTPMDKYEKDIYGLAEEISKKTGEEFSKKKNRVVFLKSNKILDLLGVSETYGK